MSTQILQLATWAVNVDGLGQMRLIPNLIGASDWDSTGNTILFEWESGIWSAPASESSVVIESGSSLTGPVGAYAPVWSTQHDSIAYSVHAGPSMGVYVSPLNGASRMVGSPGWRHPDWSPKNGNITFVAASDTATGVYVCDLSGTNPELLWGGASAFASFPRWSPTGDRLAFTGRLAPTDHIELWMMDSDGQNARRLTQTGVLAFASWNPTGEEIVYVRFSQHDSSLENGTIWIVNVVSGDARQVTFNRPSD
jgi:Tol biopolymer transport system component